VGLFQSNGNGKDGKSKSGDALMDDRVRKSIMLFVLCIVSGLIWASSVQMAEAKNYRGPFEGRVVDADTQEPIEGAVVYVEWRINHAWSRPTFFDTAEVLTDTNGAFSIPQKWSMNPWYNIVMNSFVTIFKRDYGAVNQLHWTTLHDEAKFLETLTPERRRQIGPDIYFNIRFEGDVAVFLLKRLTTVEEYRRNTPPYIGGDVPDEKAKLLRQEMEKKANLPSNTKGYEVR
jgi:hypothetical protein